MSEGEGGLEDLTQVRSFCTLENYSYAAQAAAMLKVHLLLHIGASSLADAPRAPDLVHVRARVLLDVVLDDEIACCFTVQVIRASTLPANISNMRPEVIVEEGAKQIGRQLENGASAG